MTGLQYCESPVKSVSTISKNHTHKKLKKLKIKKKPKL